MALQELGQAFDAERSAGITAIDISAGNFNGIVTSVVGFSLRV